MPKKRLTPNAQKLRNNMTPEERHLWYDFLKALPVPFHRQKPIGPYIVDFFCCSERIVIELDGSQHYEEEHAARDIQRDRYLSELGLTVLRYTNLDIQRNFEGVCTDVLQHLKSVQTCPSSGAARHLPREGEG